MGVESVGFGVVNTLESATGRPAAIYPLPDLSADVKESGTQIPVGTQKTKALVTAAMKASPPENRGPPRGASRLRRKRFHRALIRRCCR
jgi:hypothetical protein